MFIHMTYADTLLDFRVSFRLVLLAMLCLSLECVWIPPPGLAAAAAGGGRGGDFDFSVVVVRTMYFVLYTGRRGLP